MKILITGGSGLLGQYLNIALSKRNSILTVYNLNEGNCRLFPNAKLNISDKEKLREIFITFKPETVIHTAAISRPESCDELPIDYVMDVNVNASIEIARLCHIHKAKLIFTSTDLVYDGDQGQMLNEESKLSPVSLYASTKLQSEDGIRNNSDNYIILRTSLLFGMGLNGSVNNFHNMYYSFKNNKSVKLFYDQFRTPLSLKDASRLIEKLIRSDAKNTILNFGGKERVSRVELGEILCTLGQFDNSLIERTSMYDIPKLHKVADVSMNTEKMNSLGLIQKSIDESVIEILSNELKVES
jgi:dTDP-4-dehydrorhamnose reductase